jgi:RecA/RadA recombinase
MKKFDFTDVISDIKTSLKKDKKSELLSSVSLGSDLSEVSADPKDYVVMPNWFGKAFGVMGLPFNKIIQIAGDSDTGKTSTAITAMKAAQEQGYGVIFVETELKTSPQDLEAWEVDPSGVILIQTNITEQAFDLSFKAIDNFFARFPKEKLLFVFDSFGNTISLHDESLDIVTDNQKVGGAAKTNRLGLGRLITLMNKHPIAALIVNYQYSNLGSVGNTQAGGKALKFYSMCVIETVRTGDWTKVVAGKKVKIGTFVKFRTSKNHYAKSAVDENGKHRLLPKEINLRISAAGIEEVEGNDSEV